MSNARHELEMGYRHDINSHIMRKPGFPEKLAKSQETFYEQLLRAFAYQESVGPFWGSGTSIGQGCALSQIYINGFGTVWARYVEERAQLLIDEMKKEESGGVRRRGKAIW